ncbi:MAG: ester cyclase [Aestuariibacter sp.]
MKLTKLLLVVFLFFAGNTFAGSHNENQANTSNTLTRQVYQAFQTGNLSDWDQVIDKNVVTNSSAMFGVQGLDALKGWANAFLVSFAPRVDLVDEINAVDKHGNGRAVMTFNLHWQHVEPFFGISPSGRKGTSVENLIMTVKNGKVVRIEVADTTMDLVIYLHQRGWVFPQNIAPEPIIRGIDRKRNISAVSFK